MRKPRFSRFHFNLSIVVASAAWLFAAAAPAVAQRAPWERMEAAAKLLDVAAPKTDAIRLDLPAVTQDGSAVPLTVTIDHPMTADHYIESLHLFASGNPSPEVAEFSFSPLAGEARLSTRIRLDGTQNVIALARTNRGEWLAGAREVRVTVSGCLTQAGAFDGDDFMRTRVRAPNRLRRGEAAEIRTLINHPMETGLRKDADGQAVPERILTEFRARVAGQPVIHAKFHRAVAANPYLLFHVAPGQAGTLDLEWTEDTGKTATATAEIPAA